MFSNSSKLYFASCSCFFITGLSALICEVCWIRKASLAFGSSSWAMSLVLAVFFAGLAVGSYFVGRFSHRSTTPLRSYAWLEFGVACLTIASPLTFQAADWVYGQFYSSIVHLPWMLTLSRLVLASVVMLPATIMMGGTLPLFCHQFVREKRGITRGIGLLYAINTLGAAAGALLCGFWLIPVIGVNNSLFLAGSLNLLVSLFAFQYFRSVSITDDVDLSLSKEDRWQSELKLTTRLAPRERAILTGVFFGVGFVAVATEVLWTRYLSLWMPNTVYTYSLALSVVLLGIVIGSGMAALIIDRVRGRAGLIGGSQILSSLLVILVMQLPPDWWGGWFNAVSVPQQLLVVSVVMLAPSILSGLCFPLAIGMIASDSSQVGMQTGRMTAINLLGGIAGSTAVGFLMLPYCGLYYTLLLVTGMGMLLGLVALWQLAPVVPVWFRLCVGMLAAGLWGFIPANFRTQLPQAFLASGAQLVDFREGANANVSVVRSGDLLQLEINRMWQGQNVKNHQVFAGHIPALLHPAPKDVLAIGLGTGQTARSFLAHEIDRLDCLEIEDGLVDLLRAHFDAAWINDPRVHVLIEDGRNYATHTQATYDIISIEVGQIYRPRISSFYSAEFYDQLRPKLRPKGIVCQFLPIEFFGQAEFRTLIATFSQAFPQSVLWYNTTELLLMGSADDRIRFDPQHFSSILANHPELKEELDFAYWAGPDNYLSRPESFSAGFLCGSKQLQQLSEGVAVYRDDRPYLEYLPLLTQSDAPNIADLIQKHLAPLADLTDDSAIDATVAQRIRNENLQEISARAMLAKSQSFEAAGQLESAFEAIHQALRILPNYPRANLSMGTFLQSQGEPETALTFYHRALALQPTNARGLLKTSECLIALQRFDDAVQPLRQLLGQQPNHIRAHAMLGAALSSQGTLDEAEEHLQKSLALAPNQPDVLVSLAGVYLQKKQDSLADAAFNHAKSMEPKSTTLLVTMGWAYGQANRNHDALSCFEAALAINPRETRAVLGLANALQSTKEYSKAQQTYSSLVAAYPDMLEARIGLAYSLQSEGKWDEALRNFQAAIQLAPDNPSILAASAWIMATHPDPAKRAAAEAVRRAERAWKITREQAPQVGDALAAAYAANGQFDLAVETSNLAIQQAQEKKMPEIAADLERRKSLYEQKQIYTQ